MPIHNAIYKTQQLTADDRDLLQTIYTTRLRFLTAAFAAWMLSTTFYVVLFSHPKGSSEILIAVAVVFCLCASGYVIKIEPFKKDIKNGVKEIVPYTIIRKEYFEYTGQYFVALDDPKYLHHEVDAATYANCSEGDTMAIYRAPRSKFVFEDNGRFTLM